LCKLKQDRCICPQGQETHEDRVILPPYPDVNTGDPEYESAVLPTRPWFSAGGKVFETGVFVTPNSTVKFRFRTRSTEATNIK
jgi:hypothetical protein